MEKKVAFTPDPGTLFYASGTRAYVKHGTTGPFGDVVEKEVVLDRSYATKVLRCVAFDERAIVADVVFGDSYGPTRRMLLRGEHVFMPVGPGVAEALGLEK